MTLPPAELSAQPRARRGIRLPWWAWTVLAALLAVAVVAGLGGFASVAIEKVRTIPIGSVHEGNTVHTVIEGSYFTDRTPGYTVEAPEGMKYLVVEATLTNVSAEPSSFSGNVVRVIIDDVIDSAEAPRSVIERRSGDRNTFLQPGLATPVLIYWEISADRGAVGDTMYIGLFETFPVYGDPIFGDTAFSDPTPTARVITRIGEAPAGTTMADVVDPYAVTP